MITIDGENYKTTWGRRRLPWRNKLVLGLREGYVPISIEDIVRQRVELFPRPKEDTEREFWFGCKFGTLDGIAYAPFKYGEESRAKVFKGPEPLLSVIRNASDEIFHPDDLLTEEEIIGKSNFPPKNIFEKIRLMTQIYQRRVKGPDIERLSRREEYFDSRGNFKISQKLYDSIDSEEISLDMRYIDELHKIIWENLVLDHNLLEEYKQILGCGSEDPIIVYYYPDINPDSVLLTPIISPWCIDGTWEEEDDGYKFLGGSDLNTPSEYENCITSVFEKEQPTL